MKSDLSFGYKSIILWVIVALSVITVGLGIGQFYYSGQLNNVLQLQQENTQFIHDLNLLGLDVYKAEATQKGYILTGENEYLKPYYATLPNIRADLNSLKTSVIGKQYSAELDNINNLIQQKISYMNSTVSSYQAEGVIAASTIANTDLSSKLMSSIRSDIDSLSAQEVGKASTQTGLLKKHARLIFFISPVAVGINLLLILEIIILARRALVRQKLVEGYREQFVTVAAHQLRTPATAVKQYLYLLLDGYYGKITKDQREALELVNSSNERGIDVANSLLSVTRVDSGEISLKEEIINLNDLLDEVIKHYATAVRRKKNQTIVKNLYKRPVLAKVDPFYMKMVFENLIDNASKYSPEGKKIFVSLKQKDNYIYFSVKDQGIGVNKKDIPLLFRKFVRLDNAFKVNSEGSGLGLYLVKQLVALHGGKVTVDSEHSKGSTFTVRLKQAAV